MVELLLAPVVFYCFEMGPLIDELQRGEAEAEELRGRIAELAERLAGSRSGYRGW